MMETTDKLAGISSEAVRKATGRTWDEWLAELDSAGALKMAHPAIAILLHDRFECQDWWCQMITVGYEQARGLREKHQTCGGFSASASRTFTSPVTATYRMWADDASRRAWLSDPITVRKATPNKSLRITWETDGTSLDVNIYAKGAAKCQVVLQHNKLTSSEQVQEKKQFWAGRLDALKAVLSE